MRLALATIALAATAAAATSTGASIAASSPGAPPSSTEARAQPISAAQDLHKNPRFGYQFKPPRSWTSIALQSEEAWLTAKYLSNKSYFTKDDITGYTVEHKPEMMMIAFVKENMKRKKEVEEEEVDGVKTTTITINNPYKDYEDFLDRTYVGGGWYVDSKEEDEVKGLPVTKYVVKVEKLSVPKRIITWIYHTDEIDFALQTEILEAHYSKVQRLIDRTLKSFLEIERSGDLLPGSGKTVDAMRITRRELTEGTPKERRSKRVESQRQLHDRAIASLPEEWGHRYSGDILVIDHDSNNWAKKLGPHAEAVLEWIEDTFHYVGDGEYARAPIIRVCKDREEELAFSRGVRSGTSGGAYIAAGAEIYTHADKTGWIGFEVDYVNMRILENWMKDRDEDLANALPQWLSGGMRDYVAGARLSGRKLDFRVDSYNRDNARLAVSQDRATPPREIMKFTRNEFASDGGGSANASTYFGRKAEAGMLVRFLMSKEGSKNKQAKGLLEEYVRTLDEVVKEILQKERDAFKAEKAPESEDEEDEMAKARAGRWQQREREIMSETFERVFGGWSEKDWDKFQKAYFDYIS